MRLRALCLYELHVWTLTRRTWTTCNLFMRAAIDVSLVFTGFIQSGTLNFSAVMTFHIGDFIQKRRHDLLDHETRMDPSILVHVFLELCKDISMVCRVSSRWKRPRGRRRSNFIDQLKKDRMEPVSRLWKRTHYRSLWKETEGTGQIRPTRPSSSSSGQWTESDDNFVFSFFQNASL